MPRNSTGDRAGDRAGEAPSADGVAYDPADATDWDSNVDPGNVDEALDLLAGKLDGIAAGANAYVHPNHSGDVTSVADGAQTIANDAVTNAKLADMPEGRIKGRSVGAGDPQDLTFAVVRTILNVADGADVTGDNAPKAHKTSHENAGGDEISVAGLSGELADDQPPKAHTSEHVTGGGDKIRDATAGQDGLMTAAYGTKLDGIDASANAYVHPNHSGEVTSVADGAQTIANDAVTYAKMQNVSATNKVLGRVTAGAGNVEEIACTAAGRALLDDADAAAQLATLGAAAAGANITDHSVVRGDGGAKGVQDSGVLIDDADNIAIPGSTHSIGAIGTDTTLTFTGTASGVIEWDQTNGRFEMADKIRMNDDVRFVFGGSEDVSIQYRAHGTKGNLQIGTQTSGASGCTGYLSILQAGDIAHANRNPAGNSADPVLRVYSSDSAQAADYIEFSHNQTNGVITVGNGNLVLDGLTWPAADGTAGQILKTDGAGALSFVSRALAHTFYYANPQAGKSYKVCKLPVAATIKRIDHITTLALSTLVFNVEIRDETTPTVAGTDVWNVDKTANTTHSIEAAFDNAAVAAHKQLYVTIVSLGGTPPDALDIGIELELD